MKKFLPIITAIVALAVAYAPQPMQARTIKIYTFNGPSSRAASQSCPNTLSLGTVSFATGATDTVGNQIWSDAVTAIGCNKTTFYGGKDDGSTSCADCRSNPNQKGDLFSWQAVNAYKNQLCPNGWRVPDSADFRALNIALGGQNIATVVNDYYDAPIRDKYLSIWHGSYGGACHSNGTLYRQEEAADYWSQSEASAGIAFLMTFYTDGYIDQQVFLGKCQGASLRCVRDK